MMYPSVDNDLLIILISLVLLLPAFSPPRPPNPSLLCPWLLAILFLAWEGLAKWVFFALLLVDEMRSISSPSRGTLEGCMGSFSEPARSTSWTRTKCLLSMSGSRMGLAEEKEVSPL